MATRSFSVGLAVALASGCGIAIAALVGCGSDTSATGSGTAANADVAPYEGTFTASAAGSAPFAAISFLDAMHYDYLDRACLDAIQGSGDDGDGDDTTDGGVASTSDSDACVHEGSYVATSSEMTFTGDDGSTFSLPISNVQTDTSTSLTQSQQVRPDALVVGGATLTPGSGTVSSFNAGGTQLAKVNTSTSNGSSGLVQSGAVAQAFNWVNVQMPYCQAIQGAKDPTCGGTCNRPDNARNTLWDTYRSDCSGLISYSWNLGASPNGGETTNTLTNRSTMIPSNSLQPGDALLLKGHHVVMFEKWVDQDAGAAKILEEPRCMGHAQEQDRTIKTSGATHASIEGHGGTWITIRKK